MAISELNLFPNGTSSLTADKLLEQLTSQFQPLLNKASPLDGPDKSEESEKTETTDSTQSAGQTQAPAEDPDEIAFKGSIQFRFALYQLNYANQCRQNAVNYMGQIEQIQDQAEEAAEMITKARDAEAKGSGVPAEVVSYMNTNKLGMKGSASSCSSDEWSYNLASLTQYQESISSKTQTLMVYLQDFISQYNSYLQGANAAVQESASTMRAILTGR